MLWLAFSTASRVNLQLHHSGIASLVSSIEPLEGSVLLSGEGVNLRHLYGKVGQELRRARRRAPGATSPRVRAPGARAQCRPLRLYGRRFSLAAMNSSSSFGRTRIEFWRLFFVIDLILAERLPRRGLCAIHFSVTWAGCASRRLRKSIHRSSFDRPTVSGKWSVRAVTGTASPSAMSFSTAAHAGSGTTFPPRIRPWRSCSNRSEAFANRG